MRHHRIKFGLKLHSSKSCEVSLGTTDFSSGKRFKNNMGWWSGVKDKKKMRRASKGFHVSKCVIPGRRAEESKEFHVRINLVVRCLLSTTGKI